ncbi:hypothetical protein PPERSA_03707 [Pseudocohnilembus persalinus]|uniref:JmjC domain-containing protein n=1 Tax=Pseudocohnilembus persalinus TaxID=266149 RepID=A0A0V0QG41_PSEPJ|nr:hypothetical protein PPERSA_03707 [Pseudocohnilembus persalinus]|eukprot:KRX01203.1 hypothetical protein PPERSA_03707 [Pseudocohnilembus persalinus]
MAVGFSNKQNQDIDEGQENNKNQDNKKNKNFLSFCQYLCIFMIIILIPVLISIALQVMEKRNFKKQISLPYYGQILANYIVDIVRTVLGYFANKKTFTQLMIQQDQRFLKEWVQIIEYNDNMPDFKKFNMDHLMFSMPFVCRGCLKNQKAFQMWQDDDYLIEKIGDKEVMVEARYDGKSTFAYFQKEYKEVYMTYKEFASKYQDFSGQERYYLANCPMFEEIKEDLKNPELGELMDLRKFNYWQSAGGSESLPHTDAFENFLCQIDGYKEIILLPPTQREYLYLEPGVSNYSPINFFKPDYILHPFFKRVKGKMKLKLEAGDILYIPAYWWHHIISAKERTIAVNYWYAPNLMVNIFNSAIEQSII